MSYKSVIATLGITVLCIFSSLAMAQQEGKSRAMDHGQMSGGMMGGHMMMGQMMAQHEDMSQLMSKMMQSMAAIKAEKDPAKLKALLAEHAALMDQMHSKMMSQGNRMHDMDGKMKNCGRMGKSGK